MLLILGILMMVMFYLAYQKVQVTREYVILMVIFFGMLTTYFIPHMHERYLYVTDAFLLIYTLLRPKRFPLFVTASFLTVVGYAQYPTERWHLSSCFFWCGSVLICGNISTTRGIFLQTMWKKGGRFFDEGG